jgi:hypothetical protein
MDWTQATALNWLESQHRREECNGRPSIIAGWKFLFVGESDDPDSLPIRTVVSSAGPDVFYHPLTFPRSMIEEPSYTMMWLPMAINHIACCILHVSTSAIDGVGHYTSERWQEFREYVSSSMSMTWNDIVIAARIDGIAEIADHITSSLFIEDGLQIALARRVVGTASLEVV